MQWKINQARKKFTEMIHKVKEEPQIIMNRNTVVAIVIDPDKYNEYRLYQGNRETLAGAFNELRKICADENYRITVPARKNREPQW